MKRPALPPFTIRKQRIERIILTGAMENFDDALDWMAKRSYLLTSAGPKELKGKTDQTRFVVFGEKVIR